MRFGLVINTILTVLIATSPLTVHAGFDASFVPNETLVSDPDAGLQGIIDPEFDSITNQYCWVDRQGNLWVGSIDPATGLIDPINGRGTLVDRKSARVAQIGNGPEWVNTNYGPQIVYTRLFGPIPIIARAYYQNGEWNAGGLSQGVGRLGPLGSQSPGDSTPTISYQGPKVGSIRPLYVRELTDASTEQMIPTTDVFRTPGARSIPGTNAVIFTRPMPEGGDGPPRQIFVYDRDTQQLDQLTYDDGSKIAAFMWRAPEYDNEYIFFALIGEKRIGIYRYLDGDGDGSFGWERVKIIDPPGAGDYIWSPEPFVYEGKSYLVMTTSETDDQQTLTAPSEIWLTDINEDDTLYRRLSDSVVVNRKDPEVYYSDNGPYIFISRSDGEGPVIMRLDSGLGPQTQ